MFQAAFANLIHPISIRLKSPMPLPYGRHGGTVVSTAASQRQGPGFNSSLGSLSVWSSHILAVSAWVFSGCSGFLPQSKTKYVV